MDCRKPRRPFPVGAPLVLLCALALGAGSAAAQPVPAWPSKPIRMVIAFSPGGTSDTLGRILGQKITEAFGQPVVIDSRPGASGMIGADITARAAPDGYTLMHAYIGQFSVNPSLFAKLPYDPMRDFTPVSLVATAPQLVVVPPELPVKSIRDLIALAREKPGQLNFGSGGAGTLSFVGGELFQTLTGVKMVHVSYKGTVLAQNDLLAGRVQVMFSDMPTSLPQANAGKLRGIAVTSLKRSALLPSLPTVAESGVPGYELLAWWGLVGPRGLPEPLVTRLHTELVRIHALPDIRERYEALGVEPTTNTPAQFAAFMREDAARFAKLLKAAGVKAD
ncbi:MAG: tripartite tricarboxylate transporter substrate binding protein [Proteobacteria bacterium]|nr:tripartite tricarboxylate transporter substrate binding protein [Burkholderiales bacterium]